MKIYTATEETLRKEERQDETQFTTKIDGFLSFISSCMLMYFFVGVFFFFESHPVYDQTQASGVVFFLPKRIS